MVQRPAPVAVTVADFPFPLTLATFLLLVDHFALAPAVSLASFPPTVRVSFFLFNLGAAEASGAETLAQDTATAIINVPAAIFFETFENINILPPFYFASIL